MASVARSCVRHSLEAVFRAGAAGGLTDRELLDRFVNRDLETAEPAFYIADQPTRDGLVRFRLKVPNADGRLKADMLVRVRISPDSGR